jgi:hypothetical protein
MYTQLITEVNLCFQCMGIQSTSSIEHMFSWVINFKSLGKLNLNIHIEASREESVRKNANV